MNRFNIAAFSAFVFVGLGQAGCSGGSNSSIRSKIDPRPEVSAALRIQDSFQVSAEQTGSNRVKIWIAKSALEKEFLLQTATISQEEAAFGQGMKSRVVAFRKRGDQLYLLEASQGHTIQREVPAALLLAQFQILSETPTHFGFDFNAGMSSIFQYSDWHGQDFDGGRYEAGTQFISVKTRFSYLESARAIPSSVEGESHLEIRQLAQVSVPSSGGAESNVSVEVKYYLSPYHPDPTFVPVVSEGFDRVGYFEVAPLLMEDGSQKVLASKFHEGKPIVYAISANTPPEMRQAVKEGVLYWNKAFGSEIVKVVDAPAGVTAPDFEHNVVQWVDWDQAGFAYADAQMDPRSGEILHAQVFMTSTFAFSGRLSARRLLRDLQDQKSGKKASPVSRVSLAGFGSSELCHREHGDVRGEYRNQLITALSEVLNSGADDATVLRVSQDFVRSVVAHEVGHTLGLRHNFAGSVAANYSLDRQSSIVESYLKNGGAPEGIVPASTVMDYLLTENEFLVGDIVLKDSKALEYDEKAIRALYRRERYADSEMPLFCTDSHLSDFVDCKQFDQGASFVENVKSSFASRIASMPGEVLDLFIAAKAPRKGDRPVPVENVALPDFDEAKGILAPRHGLLKSLASGTGILKIQRGFPAILPSNKEEVRRTELDFALSEMGRLGGADAVFSMIPEDFTERSVQRFAALLEKNLKGVGPGNQPYEFSPQEQETMKARVASYFKKLEEKLVVAELEILGGAEAWGKLEKFADHPAASLLSELFARRIEHYVFATTGKFLEGEVEVPGENDTVKRVAVRLPEFRWSQEIRRLSAGLLADGRAEAIDWGLYERAGIKKKFDGLLQSSLGEAKLDGLEPAKLERGMAKWVLENRKVLGALSGG